MTNLARFEGYEDFLRGIKERIQTTQVRAALSLSRELTLLYWHIGREIAERQARDGWGAKVVERLAADLKAAFPGVEGFSRTNLLYMRAFAEAYSTEAIVHQLVDNSPLPWRHFISLLDKVKNGEKRAWYIRAAYEHGWSRAILEHQIETDLFGRQGKALSNFERTLPPPQSDLAQQILKDPYNFDFLTLGPDAQERQLERGLLDHVRAFLMEMGAGFTFVGSQFHFDVGGQDYYLDLLFYHLRLRCFVVVDLKMRPFIPEFAGKMNFYLSAVDDLLRHPGDAPTIGLLLCKTRDRVTVEYALRNTATPIAVAELATALPPGLAESLPTVERIESELAPLQRAGRVSRAQHIGATQQGEEEQA
jgi:predicted nuclease of restriction endonuclease-like (RecB) superfamily